MKNLFLLVFLIPFCVSAQVKQQTIYFEFNKYNVPTSSSIDLVQNIAKIKCDSITIKGFCDSIGSNEYNLSLSKNRANAVKHILIENGVNANNIVMCNGYGETNFIKNNSTEEERQMNRRVEVFFNTKQIVAKTKVATVKKAEPIAKKKDFTVGEKITLPNLKFVPGFHQLLPESEITLQHIYDMLVANPKVKVRICGHVCCTHGDIFDGTDLEYNTANLSTTRALEVYNRLIQMGIDRKRLSHIGYGGSRKLTQIETNEDEKGLNRRVELEVVEK
jgi:outer membrane protein OmpA-like peptidoglycan-associated protein